MCRNYLQQFSRRGLLRHRTTVSQLGHLYQYIIAELHLYLPARSLNLDNWLYLLFYSRTGA